MLGFRELLIKIMELMMKQKRAILSLSVVVVFITTYMLILPAFTLEKQKAAEQGGIDVPVTETSTDTFDTEQAIDDEDVVDAETAEQNIPDAEQNGHEEKDVTQDDELDADADSADDAYTEGSNVLEFSIGGGSSIDIISLVQTLGIISKDDPDGVEARAFAEEIKSVEFSDPELVWTGMSDEDTTVGDLKESNDLDCEYSADLTEDDIAEINATDVTAGSWILISLKPFTSEEMLKITMNTGKVFDIRVTYKQTSSNVLTADGDTYKITVTFDDDAEIPGGTDLEAREIKCGTDEYNQLLGRTWSELNKADSDAHNEEISDESTEEPRTTNVDTARYFELTLVNSGNEIEISEPVSVEIQYDNGPVLSEEIKSGIICFRSDETELIDDTVSGLDGEKALDFAFETTSLPTVGTYIAQETHGIETKPGKSNAFSVENRISGMPSVPALLRDAGAAESDYTNDESGLEHPVGNKSLEPNNDGTYTMSLSVKGHSNTSAEVKNKANILFVMDRSSSMITNKIDDEDAFWYYGVWGTDYTFRGDIKPKSGYQFYGVINGQYVELICNYEWNEWGQYGNYQLSYWNGYQNVPYPTGGDLYVASKTTRLVGEQTVLNGLVESLLDQNTADISDNCEVAVISFGDHRFDTKSWSSDTEEGWTGGNDTSGLESAINSPRYTSGTNWEEALQYAYQMISAKKAQDGNEEEYYVVFLTDGEPTNVEGDTSAAAHSGDGPNGNIFAYDHAKDEARTMVQEGYKFYNIFTYRKSESDLYSRYLTNYAYTGVNYDGNGDSEACQNYYTDARTTQDLIDALSTIFEKIENSIGHGDVSITDTLTTDAMTTTIVHGKANGYTYTVTEPDPDNPDHPNTLYTVTATGDLSNPTVTFHVPGSATEDYPAAASTAGDKTVYSITTAEGNTYKMALADVDDTTGELVWDLSPVGILMDDCTYSVNFIVWPDQDAYDYVAALNNGLQTITNSEGETIQVEWDDTAAVDSGKGYKTGGVAAYPSIVKYPDGSFAVLTNTDQKIHYSVFETEIKNGVPGETQVTGPYYQELQTPPPMPLTASRSSIEKKWNVERAPEILAKLLYGGEERLTLTFDVMQDENEDPYTSVSLGWDETKGRYIWEEDGIIEDVPYNGNIYSIGTRWVKDFSIATGLMLSEERMDTLGLDKTAYPRILHEGSTPYWVLEEGHDYTISEPALSYEFDFIAPVYHPMLVDGVLKNVTFEKSGGSVTGISDIEDIAVDDAGISTLKVENTLRGYIHLNKEVVDKDNDPVPTDETKFEYTIVLNNDDGPFDAEHIPWYGINNLFYHDADFNYYQATATEGKYLTLEDEAGNTFTAECVNVGAFDEDAFGPTVISYQDGEETKTIQLFGNQLQETPDKKQASVTMKINQNEVLNIANVPVGTTYTITESTQTGYELKGIEWEILPDDLAAEDKPEPEIEGSVITGTIVTNHDNHITYTNKTNVADITIQKMDGEGNGLEGAIFELRSVDGLAESPVSDVRGLENITKVIDGQEKTFLSAFETTGDVQRLSGLPDGTYRLYESYIPPGYIKTLPYIEFCITDRVMVMITEDEAVLDFTGAEGNNGLALLKITNISGAELPMTGGIGTTVFYILGAILVLAGGIYFAARKRILGR